MSTANAVAPLAAAGPRSPPKISPFAVSPGFSGSLRLTASPSTTTTARHAPATLMGRDAWTTAFWTLVIMLRNVTLSSVFAWLIAYCCSLGVATQPLASQSHADYVTAVLVWSYSFLSAINLVVHAKRLATNQFQRWPTWKPTIWYCTWRVAKGTSTCFVLCTTLLCGVGQLTGRLPTAWQRVKLEGYVFTVLEQCFCVAAALVVKKIYYEETTAGQQKRRASSISANATAPIAATAPTWRSARRTLRAFTHEIPTVLSIWCAGGYVQVIHELRFSSANAMMLCLVASTVIKFAFQEIAKHYVMASAIHELRTMCIIIGMPTVLINTQMRIVLQNRNDSATTLLGTYLMAAIEVVFRIGKVLFLKWQIHHRQAKLNRQPQQPSRPPGTDTANDPHSVFATWRKRMLSLHTAESYADMYAEYIAMGCSSAIVVFFFKHPQFDFASTTTAASSATGQYALLLFQVAIEVVVDIFSCVVEICMGIDYHNFGGFGTFLGFLFTVAGGVNIILTVILYTSPSSV